MWVKVKNYRLSFIASSSLWQSNRPVAPGRFVAGQLLGRFLGESVHLPQELLAQFDQALIKLGPFRLNLELPVLFCLHGRLSENGRGGGGPMRLGSRCFLVRHFVLLCHWRRLKLVLI